MMTLSEAVDAAANDLRCVVVRVENSVMFRLTDLATGWRVMGARKFNDRTRFDSVDDLIDELWCTGGLIEI